MGSGPHCPSSGPSCSKFEELLEGGGDNIEFQLVIILSQLLGKIGLIKEEHLI